MAYFCFKGQIFYKGNMERWRAVGVSKYFLSFDTGFSCARFQPLQTIRTKGVVSFVSFLPYSRKQAQEKAIVKQITGRTKNEYAMVFFMGKLK